MSSLYIAVGFFFFNNRFNQLNFCFPFAETFIEKFGPILPNIPNPSCYDLEGRRFPESFGIVPTIIKLTAHRSGLSFYIFL